MVHPNHLSPVEIDLSTYISDGEDHAPADKEKLPDTHCLTFLTRVFNNNGSAMEFWGRRVKFTALCPGYSMYLHTNPDSKQERRVWGHPCGKPFPNMSVFAIHVRAIIEEDLRRCGCWLCVAPDAENDPSDVKGPFDLAKMRREGISLKELKRKRQKENREREKHEKKKGQVRQKAKKSGKHGDNDKKSRKGVERKPYLLRRRG